MMTRTNKETRKQMVRAAASEDGQAGRGNRRALAMAESIGKTEKERSELSMQAMNAWVIASGLEYAGKLE